MTYPPDHHQNSVHRPSLEHDRRIINGSILALAAFVIVAAGIAWYAVTDSRSRTAAIRQQMIERQMIERSLPDGTTGYGGAQPKASAPKPGAK